MHTSQEAHRSGAYNGFCSMKCLGVLLLPLDVMPVYRRVIPIIKFADAHLYTWEKGSTATVQYLAREHNTMSWSGLEPGLLDPETNALTMRSGREYSLVWTI